MPSLPGSTADSWNPLSWVLLKSAATVRGLAPGAVTGLTPTLRQAHCRRVIDQLCRWYSFDKDRPVPELLDREELLSEAESLAIELSEEELDHAPEANLRKRIVRAHTLLKAAADFELIDTSLVSGEEAGDEEPSADETAEPGEETLGQPPFYEAPQPPPGIPDAAIVEEQTDLEPVLEDLGYPYCSNAGLAIKLFPLRDPTRPAHTRARIPPAIKRLFGTVFSVHHARLSEDNDSFEITQEFRVITGLTHDSEPNRFSFEVFHLRDNSLSCIQPSALAQMDQATDISSAFHLAQEALASTTDMLEDDVSAGSSEALGLGSSHRVSITERKLDLPTEYAKIHLLPRILEAQGLKAPRKKNPAPGSGGMGSPGTISANFADRTEQDTIRRAEILRKHLADGIAPVLAGLERKMEAYIQPMNENLVTGDILDPRLSEADKLSELARSYSLVETCQDICCFCVPCTSSAVERARVVDSRVDMTNPDTLKALIVYGDPGAICCMVCPGKNGKGQPLHPNPFVPTVCYSCQKLVYFRGAIAFACPHCSFSYIMPSGGVHPSLKRLNESERDTNDALALENRVFQYLRLTGGPDSPFLGSAEDITQGRYRMSQQSQTFFQENRDYPLTPRHVLYGPALEFAKTPNGLHGLSLRDFIPTRARLYELLQGANGESNASEFEIWNTQAYGGATRLREWVEDNMPWAPPWPKIDNAVVGESVIMRALENMGSFLIDLGKRREIDVELTKKALKLEMVGINADALPMIEHKTALTFYTFGSRVREQATDFRFNRQYEFEKKAGPFIRLVYTHTLPLIIQEIKLPLEQHMHSAAVSILYSGKFGSTGYLLSNETSAPPKKARSRGAAKKNAGSGSAGGGSLQPSKKLTDQMIKSSITLKAGTLVGDRLPNTKAVLNAVPVTDSGQAICANFQTCAGCQVGDLPCPLAHVKCTQFNPESQRYFLARGGHDQWADLSLLNLKPWLPEHFTSPHSELLAAQTSALKHVDKLLERLNTGGSEKRAIHPVTQGKATKIVTPITAGGNTPIPLWSTSGVRAKSVNQMTLGVGEAYFDGNSWDCGDTIELLNGHVLHNRCLVKSLASQIRPSRVFISERGRSLELELNLQILEGLLSIDITTLPLNSRAAEIYVNCAKAESQGYDEALLDIVSPPLLAHSNVLLVSQGDITDPDDKKSVSVRLWPAGLTMHTPRENWRKSAAHSAKFFTEWNWGHSAMCAELVGLASVFVSDDTKASRKKHATGYDLPKKLHSWSQLTALLARFTEFKQEAMEVRVVSKASLGSLRAEQAAGSVTKQALASAQSAMRKELDLILENSLPDAPYRLAALKKKTEDLEKAKNPKNKSANSISTQGAMSGPFLSEPPSVTQSEKARRETQVHPSVVAGMAYMDLVRTLDSGIDRTSPTSVEAALIQAKTATTVWYEIEKSNPTREDLDATGRQVAILRHLAFGDRASEGPDWLDIATEIKGSLTEGHLSSLEELIRHGHDSAWIGPSAGYAGEERPGLEAASLQVLSSMWDGVLAWKALVYDELLEKELLDTGLIIAPMDVVEKLDDRKQRRYDEKAQAYKLRCVTDHTDSGAKLALNSGTASYRTVRQITTDNASTAALAITEEANNPNSFIGQEKCDYTGAFTIVQLILQRCKERSIKFHSIILCNLCLTFGGADAPGAWEHVGAAPSSSICVIPWPDPTHDGGTIPAHTRFVDDTHHIVAFRGNRQARYAKGFKALMRIWAGNDSLNLEKEQESGGYTLRQHGFGKLVDSFKRSIATPLSRLCRTEDKLIRYLDDPKARFSGVEVPAVAGSLRSTLESAPGLGALCFPRFDAMLSATAKEYGSKRPPSSYQPSPALDGESREEGEAMLRLTLTLAWRLASLNDGEYLVAGYEQWLPFDLRITCPGKERIQQFLFPESDASGKALLFFDPITGVYIQEAYTKGEIDAMFDYGRSDHGIIITNMEGYADTIGIPLTVFDHPDPVLVAPRNDNMGFVDGLNGNKTTNVKNLHCIITLRVWSFLTGVDLHAIYVKTDDNLRADPGSRPEKEGEWLLELAKWEATTGLKARRLEVPPVLRDLSTWIETPTCSNLTQRVQDSCRKLLAILDFYEAAGTSNRLRVPIVTARAVILECLNESPIPRLDRSKEDFPPNMGPSPVRATIMAGPPHRTRVTLMKQVAKRPEAIHKLREEVSAPPTICHQEVFNQIMQLQFQSQRHLLWEASSAYMTPPTSTRLGSPITHVPLNHVTDKVKFAELYAGRASLSRSCNDSGGGITVAVSEHNPRNWDELVHALPEARLFESNEVMTLKILEQLEVEGVGGGSPCQAHSGGNPHARGNQDPTAGGEEYEQTGALMSQMYGGLGPAFQIWENSPGVKKRQPGCPLSPYEELLLAAPQFTDAMQGVTLQASKVKSPLTGATTPLNHERLFVVLVNKACFPEGTSIVEAIPQVRTDLTASTQLDSDSETPGRFVMPDQDVYGFEFKHSHGKSTGICMSGNISDPAPGMGWGSFPNQAWDPHGGYAVTMTSGGARWMQTSFNAMPRFVHATNSEYARLYQFRDPPLDPSWLDPDSEFGMHVISHSIVQSVADAVVVETLRRYTTPMSLADSKAKGFDHCVSPQAVYHSLRTSGKQSRSNPAAGNETQANELNSSCTSNSPCLSERHGMHRMCQCGAVQGAGSHRCWQKVADGERLCKDCVAPGGSFFGPVNEFCPGDCDCDECEWSRVAETVISGLSTQEKITTAESEDIDASPVSLPQELVAHVCSQAVSSILQDHESEQLSPVVTPPMLLTSKTCVSLMTNPSSAVSEYALNQAAIAQGRYPKSHEEDYFMEFGGRPSQTLFLGHLAKSLSRDLQHTDIEQIVTGLYTFDLTLGIPLFGRSDWGEPSMIPEQVLEGVSIKKRTLVLFYPLLLVDAARNCAIYQHFQVSHQVARWYAKASAVSRKSYIAFSPAVAEISSMEYERLVDVWSVLQRKVPDSKWHCPETWALFHQGLANKKENWRKNFTYPKLVQMLPSTSERDHLFNRVTSQQAKLPHVAGHAEREIERYTVTQKTSVPLQTGFGAKCYRDSDEAFWTGFSSEDSHSERSEPVSQALDCVSSTSTLALDWIPPPLLTAARWIRGKLSRSSSTAGSGKDTAESCGRLSQIKKKRLLRKQIVKTHFTGPVTPDRLLARDGLPIQIVAKGHRRRPMPVITDEMNARIDEILIKETNPKRAKIVHQQAQHYLDFCHASKLEPLIDNPLDPLQQISLLRFAGFERSEKENKSDSIKTKFDAIDKFHTQNGFTAPSMHCEQLQSLLAQWKKIDVPPQPRIPVSHQVIELYTLENPMITEDQRAKPTSMAIGLEVCLRSCEYTTKDNGEYDPKALHWRDVFFRNEVELATGPDVQEADRLTLSVSSNKNSLMRCTRTIFLTSSSVSAVRLLKQRYLDILLRTGAPPEPNTPVFLLSTGKPISRRDISSTIQKMLESLGVPSRFSGSHSLRRGGSCMYRAAGMPDADVARFGRWTSNAYKLYIHIESSALAEWSERAAQQMPRFELN